MAQKAKVKNQSLGIFSRSGPAPSVKAQPADNSDLKGAISPVGVGLTAGEKAALKALAESHELTLNALMRFALRRFIVDVRACLLYTSPSPRDGLLSRMPSSA